MLVVFVRTVMLYSVVVITMRLMGKRQIGQLEPFELVIAIMIAELAAIPMEDREIPIIDGLVPLLILLCLQILLSYLSLKSVWLRALVDGRPTIVIENGKINEKALYGLRYNLHELFKQLRVKGHFDISDVEYAILETSGELSVIPKSQKRPLTPGDMDIDTKYEGLPIPLILDGELSNENLQKIGQTEQWLKNELQKHGISNLQNVLVAVINTEGQIYFQEKERMGGRK